MYCWHVSSGIPLKWANSYTAAGFPPLHEPPAPQFKITCGLIEILGNYPLLRMLNLSAKDEVVPCAQHDPQYCGIC